MNTYKLLRLAVRYYRNKLARREETIKHLRQQISYNDDKIAALERELTIYRLNEELKEL